MIKKKGSDKQIETKCKKTA